MKQFSNLQSHGLDRFEELSGAEAAQINGGSPESVDRQSEILWDMLEVISHYIEKDKNITSKSYHDNYVNNFSNEYLDSF